MHAQWPFHGVTYELATGDDLHAWHPRSAKEAEEFLRAVLPQQRLPGSLHVLLHSAHHGAQRHAFGQRHDIDTNDDAIQELAWLLFTRRYSLTCEPALAIETRMFDPNARDTAGELKTLEAIALAKKMFDESAHANIDRYMPQVMAALETQGLGDRVMVIFALSTIGTENSQFLPKEEVLGASNTKQPSYWRGDKVSLWKSINIDGFDPTRIKNPTPAQTKQTEEVSKFLVDSKNKGSPFDLYISNKNLANKNAIDAYAFRGRGFIQLTGRWNYEHFGYVSNPDAASQPENAAKIFAIYIKEKEKRIRAALWKGDIVTARAAVNGRNKDTGLPNGMKTFRAMFVAGAAALKLKIKLKVIPVKPKAK